MNLWTSSSFTGMSTSNCHFQISENLFFRSFFNPLSLQLPRHRATIFLRTNWGNVLYGNFSSNQEIKQSNWNLNRRSAHLSQPIVSSWLFAIHFQFNHVLAKDGYHLIRRWMRLTFEAPVKSEREYCIAGLSARKTKQFFEKENAFLVRHHQILNIGLFGCCFIFPLQLFFVRCVQVSSLF